MLVKKMFYSIIVLCIVLGVISCERTPGKKTEPDVVFVATPHRVVREMLKLAGVTKEDIVYDLGSGDGRIVIAAARDFGAFGVGIEIDQQLVAESIENARRAGVAGRTKFVQGDLFAANLREATVVTMFLLPSMIEDLTPKLLKELRPGTRVVSHRYTGEEWQPDMTLSAFDTYIYCWIVPVNVQGEWKVAFSNTKGTKEYRLSLKQRYQKIQGTLHDDKKRYKLSHTELSGENIMLNIVETVDSKLFRVDMEGVVKGETIEGTAMIAERAAPEYYTFRATRTGR